MNIEELWDLGQWVKSEIVNRRIRDFYVSLAGAVQQNARNQRVALETEKSSLLNALRAMDLSTLTTDQVDFLRRVGLAHHIGETGAKTVEKILFDGGLDIVTAAARLDSIADEVSAALDRFDKIREGLHDLQISTSPEPIKDGEVLLRVTFTGEASISNVVDLKEWGNSWHTIARGIAMAHDQPPESVRVVGAGQGSIIIELATTVAVAKTASVIILDALKVTERVLGILEQVEKVKGMHLGNKKIAHDLQKEAEKERSEGVTQITRDTCAELGVKKEGDGEKFNALESAIKNLVGFLTQGGEVDCVAPDAGQDEQEAQANIRAQLAQTFKEIRQLEAKTRRLEHKPPPSD